VRGRRWSSKYLPTLYVVGCAFHKSPTLRRRSLRPTNCRPLCFIMWGGHSPAATASHWRWAARIFFGKKNQLDSTPKESKPKLDDLCIDLAALN